ncbi:MAG: protein kinase family protein [Spirulinaceae cyanobacterium]
MSYCLNTNCPHPHDPRSRDRCQHCGSPLHLPHGGRATQILQDNSFYRLYEVQGENKQLWELKVLTLLHPRARALFAQEAQVLQDIDSPGLPQVVSPGYFELDLGWGSDPLPCLLLKKPQGFTLAEWQRSRSDEPISENLARDWLRQLVVILKELHSRLHFHRDIQPANILLRSQQQLSLINLAGLREAALNYFAFAQQSLNTPQQSRPIPGFISPGYTPWEQIKGKGVPQSDFFSLGRTFVYLLAGKAPQDFPEDPLTGRLIWQHRASHISPALIDLIDDLMASQAGDRPHNAAAILQRLDGIEQTPQLNLSYSEDSIAATSRPPKTASSQRRWRRRYKTLRPYKCPLLVGGLCLSLGIAASQIYLDTNPLLRRLVTFLAPTDINRPVAPAPTPKPLMAAEAPSSPEIGTLVQPPTGAVPGVNAVAYSPDGKILASGGRDGAIALWDAQTGELLRNIKAHSHGINAIAYSPDGQQLATGSGDNTIKLWALPDGELQHTLDQHTGWVFSLAYSPDGQTLASGGGDRAIALWDTQSGQLRTTLNGHQDWVLALAYSPDGQTLASGGSDHQIMLWQPQNPNPPKTIHTGNNGVFAVAIAPDNRTLASASGDGSIQLWNLTQATLQTTLTGHRDWVRSLVFSPDGRLLASGGGDQDNSIRLWQINNNRRLLTLEGHIDQIRSLAFDPAGNTLASGSSDNTIKLWRMP